MSLAKLTKLVRPPRSPVESPKSARWAAHEKQLGTALPADYKALIAAYGTGAIDGFIWLANPFSTLMPWKPGARIFVCYKASEESEVRRIVRDATGEARWKLESIVDFASKQPRWEGKP